MIWLGGTGYPSSWSDGRIRESAISRGVSTSVVDAALVGRRADEDAARAESYRLAAESSERERRAKRARELAARAREYPYVLVYPGTPGAPARPQGDYRTLGGAREAGLRVLRERPDLRGGTDVRIDWSSCRLVERL